MKYRQRKGCLAKWLFVPWFEQLQKRLGRRPTRGNHNVECVKTCSFLTQQSQQNCCSSVRAELFFTQRQHWKRLCWQENVTGLLELCLESWRQLCRKVDLHRRFDPLALVFAVKQINASVNDFLLDTFNSLWCERRSNRDCFGVTSDQPSTGTY